MEGIVSLGYRIRVLRRARGMTQQDLAKASGTSRSTIAGIETGERNLLSLPNVVRLADAFGVSIDYLIGRSESK